MLGGKGPEAVCRLQFLEMLTACLVTAAVVVPERGGHFQLLRGDFEQWREGAFALLQHYARKAQVAELDGEAEPVGWAAVLTN
jgi:hypothetical protein